MVSMLPGLILKMLLARHYTFIQHDCLHTLVLCGSEKNTDTDKLMTKEVLLQLVVMQRKHTLFDISQTEIN